MEDPTGHRPVLRSVGPLARWAVLGLLLVGAARIVTAVWEIRLALAGEPASGPPDQGEGVHRPLTALEDSYHYVTSVTGAVFLLCAVAFLIWLQRVRDNARSLSGRPPRYAGVWVYLGWIVPVANLWVPRGVVADVYRTGTGEQRVPFVLNLWWVLWLLGLVSGVGPLFTDDSDALIARAYTELPSLLVTDALTVGAAVAAVFVVRAVSGPVEAPGTV